MPGMPVSEQNCHPFQWGRYMWMHNGMVCSTFLSGGPYSNRPLKWLGMQQPELIQLVVLHRLAAS